jgi:general secretion pathway protein J
VTGAATASGSAGRARSRAAGFTLLEVLVALAALSLMSVTAFGALRTVLTTQDRVDARMARFTSLQTGLTRFAHDVEQIVARPVRDRHGDRRPVVIGGVAAAGPGLEFTRAGWSNPTGAARSELQRVKYLLADDRLVRRAWPVLDRGGDSAPVERVLIDDVEALTLRFLDGDRRWRDEWPPGSEAVAGRGSLLAVELTLRVRELGELRRLLALPAGAIR